MSNHSAERETSRPTSKHHVDRSTAKRDILSPVAAPIIRLTITNSSLLEETSPPTLIEVTLTGKAPNGYLNSQSLACIQEGRRKCRRMRRLGQCCRSKRSVGRGFLHLTKTFVYSDEN
ncbi:MAG: hypothetical protein KI790_14500 [Cyclobacteriaceae bacterium]|nr:hypothetical protein [Cyclobacteriaceae bacterium HetDA_MAG_MS6]